MLFLPAQSDWVSSFSVSAPGLIALNPRKKLFAVLKNSFSDKHIDEFVSETACATRRAASTVLLCLILLMARRDVSPSTTW